MATLSISTIGTVKRHWTQLDEKRLGTDWPVLAEDEEEQSGGVYFDDQQPLESASLPKHVTKEAAAARDPYGPVFAWLAKQPAKERIATLRVSVDNEDSEAKIGKILAQLEKVAGVRRIVLGLPESATGACLANIPSVEYLALSISLLPKFDLTFLGKLTKLVGLRVMGPHLPDGVVDLGPIGTLPALRKLRLQYAHAKLAKVPPSLTELVLRGRFDLPPMALDRVGLISKDASLASLANLTSANQVLLELGNVGVKVDLKETANLPARKVTIKVGYTKGRVSLRPLAKAAAIKDLTLVGSFADLASLEKGSLETLDISYLHPSKQDEAFYRKVSKGTKSHFVGTTVTAEATWA